MKKRTCSLNLPGQSQDLKFAILFMVDVVGVGLVKMKLSRNNSSHFLYLSHISYSYYGHHNSNTIISLSLIHSIFNSYEICEYFHPLHGNKSLWRETFLGKQKHLNFFFEVIDCFLFLFLFFFVLIYRYIYE